MEHIEMVEKLHEKANISYSDARDALERSGWDMLEAIVILEREGKISPFTASASSGGSESAYQVVAPTASDKDGYFSKSMSKAWQKIKKILTESIKNYLVVTRNGGEILRVQILIAVILCLCMWEIVLIALVVGLICDCRYSIENNE